MFREYTQRAGMQQVLDIRSEQIDVYLNNAIKDLIMARIQVSIQDVDSRAISTIVKTGQNNDFRTLFKVAIIPMVDISASNKCIFDVNVDEWIVGNLVSNGASWPISDALIYYNYHVNYCVATTGWVVSATQAVTRAVRSTSNKWTSPINRARLIEYNYLGSTLADNILRPNVRNPIIVTQSVDGSNVRQKVSLYFGKFGTGGTLANSLVPYQLHVGYYRNPILVHLGADVNEPDVDCDLPGHLHPEVVQRAIQYYQIARGASATQQAQPKA